MEKTALDERQKKDVETFAQMPEEVRRDLLNYGAGMMRMSSMIGKQEEQQTA